MAKKKYLIGFTIIIIPFLIWYLFIKKSDYTITFKAKTASGTIFQGISDLTATFQKDKNVIYKIKSKSLFNQIEQEVTNGTQKIDYTWNIEPINDSITEVTVDIKEEKNSIYNRLTAPFFNTEFKKEQIQKISDFRDGLNDHLKGFKVKIEGESSTESTFVAYINLKSVLQEKAQIMIMNDANITGYLAKNNIKIIGKPYLEVVSLDFNTEKIEYNYCFPIDKGTQYVPNNKVKFKQLTSQRGISATYNGNYRTSDRAWFAIFDYAKKHNLKLNNKPIEHFMNNPFNGGNELEWETKIVIPFEKQ